jgi:hypothetical protein
MVADAVASLEPNTKSFGEIYGDTFCHKRSAELSVALRTTPELFRMMATDAPSFLIHYAINLLIHRQPCGFRGQDRVELVPYLPTDFTVVFDPGIFCKINTSGIPTVLAATASPFHKFFGDDLACWFRVKLRDELGRQIDWKNIAAIRLILGGDVVPRLLFCHLFGLAGNFEIYLIRDFQCPIGWHINHPRCPEDLKLNEYPAILTSETAIAMTDMSLSLHQGVYLNRRDFRQSLGREHHCPILRNTEDAAFALLGLGLQEAQFRR